MRKPYQQLFRLLRLRRLTRHPRIILGILIGMAAGQITLANAEDAGAAQAALNSTPEAPTGQQIYNNVCVACHSPPGAGGAPALGDGDAWAERIAQGTDTLIDHALTGFSGVGIMPKKGGRPDLSDEEIIAAVKYMVEQAAQ